MKNPSPFRRVFMHAIIVLWRAFVVTLILMLVRAAIYASSGVVVGRLDGNTLGIVVPWNSWESPLLADGLLPPFFDPSFDVMLTNVGRHWVWQFSRGIGLWVVLAVVLSHFLFVRRLHKDDRGESLCRQCGYILKGLSEPRCPECGEAI